MKFRIKNIGSILLGLLLSTAVSSQVKKANEAFDHHHYDEAIELYNTVIRKDLDNDLAITNLAICYWKTDQYSLAEYWFTRAAFMNDDPQVKLWYSQLLISNEKYESAAEWLRKYAAAITDPDLVKQAEKMANYCTAIGRGGVSSYDCEVFPVSINSPDLEFGPVIWGDMLLFTSNREGTTSRNDEDDPWTHSRFTDLFMAPRTGKNQFGKVSLFEPAMLTTYHEGPAVFSPAGDLMILTKSDVEDKKRRYDASRNTRLKLVEVRRDANGIWNQFTELPFSSSEYNTAHGAITPDGNWLLFSSDMEGGFGGMDLYKCMRNADGSWGSPQNLGKHINTMGNELFPVIHSDNTLYLASDLHLGFGGLDIYKCAWNGDEWSAPNNLGSPINSSKDDFSIVFDADGESGFFCSNRNVSNKDDLLFFQFSSNIIVEGTVIDCSTREPIANAEVKLNGANHYTDIAFTGENGKFTFGLPINGDYELEAIIEGFTASSSCSNTELVATDDLNEGDRLRVKLALTPSYNREFSNSYVCGRVTNSRYGNPLANAKINLMNQCTGETTQAETDYTGSYFLPVQSGCDYILVTSKDNFSNSQTSFKAETQNTDCFEMNLALNLIGDELPPLLNEAVVVRKGMVLELFHIYFDRDEYFLRSDAMQDLETLHEILVKYPSMKGEVIAHTDSRANKTYNLQLSNRRANSVVDWLIEQGISADRLTALGYGESNLKNNCSDGIDCTETQHERNRRVEFRVTDLGRAIDEMSLEH